MAKKCSRKYFFFYLDALKHGGFNPKNLKFEWWRFTYSLKEDFTTFPKQIIYSIHRKYLERKFVPVKKWYDNNVDFFISNMRWDDFWNHPWASLCREIFYMENGKMQFMQGYRHFKLYIDKKDFSKNYIEVFEEDEDSPYLGRKIMLTDIVKMSWYWGEGREVVGGEK